MAGSIGRKRKAEQPEMLTRLVKQRTSEDAITYKLVYTGPQGNGPTAFENKPINRHAGTRAAEQSHKELKRTRAKEIKEFLASLTGGDRKYKKPLQEMLKVYEHDFLDADEHPATDKGFAAEVTARWQLPAPWTNRKLPSLKMLFGMVNKRHTRHKPVESDFMTSLLVLATDVPEQHTTATPADYILLETNSISSCAGRDASGSAET